MSKIRGCLDSYFSVRHFRTNYRKFHPVSAKIRRMPSTLKKSGLGELEYVNSIESSKKLTDIFKSYRTTSFVNPDSIEQTFVKDEHQKFLAVYPDIVTDLTEAHQESELMDAANWYAKNLWYNQPNGQYLGGFELVMAYRMLASPETLTSKSIREAQIMGWCYEMLQATFIVVDDIIDRGETRWNRKCWYRHSDVGVHAVNDASMIGSGIYHLLHKHFIDKPFYLKAVHTLNELTLKTCMGQTLEHLTTHWPENDKFENFTMERYYTIVNYKTVHYTTVPIIIAMYMAGINDENHYKKVRRILQEIGTLWQTQNDYLDCFRDQTFLGKTETDIQDGLCTWLAVTALQRCTPEQRRIMEDCYGSTDPDKVEAVKQLYHQLNLQELFKIHEERSYNLITKHIQQLPTNLKHEIFFHLIEKLHFLLYNGSEKVAVRK